MKHIRCASAALLITDIIADLIAVHMDAGMTGIAAASGAAYFCACLVITLFFLGKRSMFRIQFCRPDTDSLRQVVLFGLPMLIKELSGIIWPLSVNRLMMRYGTVTGLAALSIQDAVHYIPAALCSGIASATLVISGIFAGEHDKQGLRGLNTSILRWSLIGGTSVALALGIVSRPMMFLFTEDPKVLSLSISALRLYLIGVPFLALNYAVVSYLQWLGKHRTSGTVLFLNHILLSVSSAFILAVLFRTEGIFASYGVCEMVMTLLIAASLFIFFKVRKKTIFSGADRDDPELRRKIRSVEDAVNASADVDQFCTDNGIAGREAHLISLCTEELAVNSIKHGFQDQKQHHLDLRVVESENSLLLRLRDDCRRFDLVEWHRMMNPDDPAINIGLRIVFAEADDVNYSSALSLNNVCVRCFTERKEPDGDQTPAGT